MNKTITWMLGVALFLVPVGPAVAAEATAQVDNSDIVKAELEKAAEAAAAARSTQLLRDPRSPVFGNPDGDVTLVKFTDYQCSFCKAADPRIDKLIADDPRVRVVVKEFPILGAMSVVAAKAALASAKQGKYHDYHKGLMGHRGQLKEENIFGIAADAGLNVAKLKADMASPEVADQLIDNFNLARALKVSLTPAYIVNATVLAGVSVKTSSAKIDFAQEVAAARAKAK
jgi:protein-disulfide isomerase